MKELNSYSDLAKTSWKVKNPNIKKCVLLKQFFCNSTKVIVLPKSMHIFVDGLWMKYFTQLFKDVYSFHELSK